MRIISIVSSYRKNGNANNVIKLIERQLREITQRSNIILEYERILLSDYNINLCRGCRVCFDEEEQKCPLNDEILTIRDKINRADGIILASHVYVEDINGIMKNWIDRMAFNCHRPSFAAKSVFLITTSGIGTSNHAIKTMKRALCSWGFYISGQEKFRTGSIMDIGEIEKKYESKIKKVTCKLFRDISNNRAINPTFYSLLSFKVQQSYWNKYADDNYSRDYNYWLEKGWVDSKCDYYIKHNSNPIKVKIARAIGALMAMFYL